MIVVLVPFATRGATGVSVSSPRPLQMILVKVSTIALELTCSGLCVFVYGAKPIKGLTSYR